jgi:hypothetical protein
MWPFGVSQATAADQSAQPAATVPLSIEEVLKLSKGGVSEDVIITRIKKNGRAFDLTAEELVELKRAGLTDNIVRFLLDPSQPNTPAPPVPPTPREAPAAPPKPSLPAKTYPADPNAARVPPEPAMYHFVKDKPAKIDIKVVLGETEGAGVGKILLKKGKVVGYLLGAAAKFRIAGDALVFYARLPEGKGVEDLVLVAMEPRNGRREVNMGPDGAKQQLKAEDMRQFDSVEVGPGLFRLSTVGLGQGEYLFFFLGSADPAKATYGKAYDFGIGSPK